MPLTKFLRIAVEGATVDGRTIDRNWIDEMAAGYDPKTYTARINCEHIAGFSPEPPFNAYGSVAALRATDVELRIDGKPKKLRALEAQLDVNEQLLAINKKGQKLFTSCEISPSFAATGKAGLVGLAVTDNPASLGTEMLQFAAKASVNPLAARKQNAANYFSAAEEAAIEIAEEGISPADTAGVLASVKGLLDTFAAKFARGEEKPSEEEKPADPPKPANDNDLSKFAAAIGETVTKAIETYAAANDARVKAIDEKVEKLTQTIETTDSSPNRRSLSTGADSGRVKTDC